jgi:hypothetical protein
MSYSQAPGGMKPVVNPYKRSTMLQSKEKVKGELKLKAVKLLLTHEGHWKRCIQGKSFHEAHYPLCEHSEYV